MGGGGECPGFTLEGELGKIEGHGWGTPVRGKKARARGCGVEQLEKLHQCYSLMNHWQSVTKVI